MTTPPNQPPPESVPPPPTWPPVPAPRTTRPWALPVATGLAGLIAGSTLTFALTNGAGDDSGSAASQASATPSHWVQPETSAAPVPPLPEPTYPEEIEVGNQQIPLAPTHQRINVGEVAKTSQWAVTIKSVRLNAPEENPLIKADRDKEGKRKGVVTVSVTNLTSESQGFDVNNDKILYILDQDGNTSFPHEPFSTDQINVFAKAVKAGAHATGVLEFDYYADATAFRILVCEAQAPANNYQGLVTTTVLFPSATNS
ncbi:hypothetical protein [Streptomyces cinereoruber]|uniref:hypothetical protein n=1 Tax=Streptomyces cinereoruber TaxID=67260 RepID=UPI003C2CFE8E